MTEPARVRPADVVDDLADVDPAVVAIAERLSRGDATALVDLLELRGGTVKSISVGDPR